MKILPTESINAIIGFCCFNATIQIMEYPKSIDIKIINEDGIIQDASVPIISLQSDGDPSEQAQRVLTLIREL